MKSLPTFYSFTTKEYKHIAENWALSLKEFPRLDYSVFCLDEESYSFLSRKKIECERFLFPPPFDGRYHHGLKLSIYFYLLNQKKPFILSDADAIILQDPTDILLPVFNNGDFVFSKGQQENLFKDKFGFCLCAGWQAVSKPNKTSWLQRKIANALDKSGSGVLKVCDQIFLNETFVGEVTPDSIKYDAYSLFNGERTSVGVVENKFITRGAPEDDTLIWHPTVIGAGDTTAMMRRWDKWKVD